MTKPIEKTRQETEHSTKASSFADPEDVRRYRWRKSLGDSDSEAFKYGDNGIGCWGDDTTEPRPMCALPPEDWKAFGREARGKRVLVKVNGRAVVCELRDTMPARRFIKNGCGIDLNPEACFSLGLKPPVRVDASWSWAPESTEIPVAVAPGLARVAVWILRWLKLRK